MSATNKTAADRAHSARRFRHLIEHRLVPESRQDPMAERRSPGPRVVSVGTNSNLLALRHAILQLAGFDVWSTSSMPLAQAFMKHERCGVLVLCYSVTENWRNTLVRSFRESCHDGRIVAIVGGNLKRISGGFDAVISATDNAEALLEAVSGEPRGTRKAS